MGVVGGGQFKPEDPLDYDDECKRYGNGEWRRAAVALHEKVDGKSGRCALLIVIRAQG